MTNKPGLSEVETAKRHLRDCMESPDYPVHNCYATCNDVAYLLAEAERLRAELAQEQFNIQQATEHLVDYAREIERLKSGQHTINIAGTSSESAGTVTIPCGYAAEVGRLRAEVEQVELINFRRVEENTRLRKALTMIRNAVDITRDQVTEGWIIGVADDALKLG